MTALIALICYAATWASLIVSLKSRTQLPLLFKISLPLGIAVHSYLALNAIYDGNVVYLGIFKVSSLLFVVMNGIVALSALRLPLNNIFLILLPLSTISIALSASPLGETGTPLEIDLGMTVHILLSITAYSLLTIATLQALLLYYQNQRLKSHHVKSILGVFPPLQTMERLLFDLVWAGFILLTLSVVTGIYFIDDIFVQKLSHKSAFSVGSWLLYATLLFGRHILGWRGRAAIRWVIAGFILLMLAYFGSKFVIEIVLQYTA